MNIHSHSATSRDTAQLRPARPDDARVLAKLIDIAGEGIPHHLWSGMAAAGQAPLEVGEARARRESGGFSYRHATVADLGGAVAGMMLGYRLGAASAADRAGLRDLPAVIRPFAELEFEAPDSFYVNALAVLPGRRGAGIGSQLMMAAEGQARAAGATTLSIQVFSQNDGALRLYRRLGYVTQGARQVLEHPCQPYYDDRILLLVKPL